jgi:hypothetical protein
MIEGSNPIPHILKDLENWSIRDMALLITYLNRGCYQEFVKRITTCPQEDLEKNWMIYHKTRDEILNSQRSLTMMEYLFFQRSKDAETLAMHKINTRGPNLLFIDEVDKASPEDMKVLCDAIDNTDLDLLLKTKYSLRSER